MPNYIGPRIATGLFIGKQRIILCSIPSGKLPLEFIRKASEFIELRQKQRSDKPLIEIKGKQQKEASIFSAGEARALQAAFQKVAFKKGPISISLSPAFCVTRYFEIPFIHEKELKEAVHYEAARYLPYRLEETFGDYLFKPKINSAGKKIMSISYTAVKKETVIQYYNFVRQMNGSALHIEPIFSSLARILTANQVLRPSESAGIIFIEGHHVNITLLWEGIVYLSHDFLLSEDLSTNQNRFLQEIKTSTEYAQRSWGVPLAKKIFLAGYGEIESWNEILTQGSAAQFQIISIPLAKPLDPVAEAETAVPVGLAMRQMQQKSVLSDLQLLPSEVRGLDISVIRKWLILEAFIFLILFVAIRFIILQPQVAAIQKKVEVKTGFSDKPLMFLQQEYQNAQMDYESIQRRLTALEAFDKDRILLYKKMKAIGVTKPTAVWLQQIQFDLFGHQQKKFMQEEGVIPPVAPRILFRGFCYLGNPEREVSAVNEWAKTLEKNAEFMEGLKGLSVSEIKRGIYLTQQVTEFFITSKGDA